MSMTSMPRRGVLVSMLIPTLMLAAINAAPQADRRGAPTPEELANISYAGIERTAVLLRQGIWDGESSVPGSSSRPRIELVQDFRLVGDLTGDGADDAVVLLSASSGGSGTFLYLAVAAHRGHEAVNVATALIGDRVQVRSGRIIGGRIELDVLQAGPNDPMCCPTQTATRGWILTKSELQEDPAKNLGILSLQDLEGHEWLLSHMTRNEAAPAQPRVSLRVEGNRISGSGGCNRYFGDIRSGAPGELTIGPLATTRMACGDDTDRLEARFLKELQKVNRYGFLAGKLELTYDEGGTAHAILFKPE